MKKKLFLFSSLIFWTIAVPVFAYAQISVSSEPPTFTLNPANVMLGLITLVWQFAVGVGVIMIIVAGILFMTANGEPSKLSQARQAVIWSIVGFIVAIVAFSITAILGNIIK